MPDFVKILGVERKALPMGCGEPDRDFGGDIQTRLSCQDQESRTVLRICKMDVCATDFSQSQAVIHRPIWQCLQVIYRSA